MTAEDLEEPACSSESSRLSTSEDNLEVAAWARVNDATMASDLVAVLLSLEHGAGVEVSWETRADTSLAELVLVVEVAAEMEGAELEAAGDTSCS